MEIVRKVKKIGGSLMLPLPPYVLEVLGAVEGTELTLTLENDKLTVAPRGTEEPADLRARAERAETLLSTASEFRLPHGLVIQKRGANQWAITDDCSVLNANGRWEFEPHPSNRDEEFIARTRFTLDEALEHAEAYIALDIA